MSDSTKVVEIARKRAIVPLNSPNMGNEFKESLCAHFHNLPYIPETIRNSEVPDIVRPIAIEFLKTALVVNGKNSLHFLYDDEKVFKDASPDKIEDEIGGPKTILEEEFDPENWKELCSTLSAVKKSELRELCKKALDQYKRDEQIVLATLIDRKTISVEILVKIESKFEPNWVHSSEANLAEFMLALNSILKPEILGPELAVVQLLRSEWSGKIESLDQYFRKLEDEKYRISNMAEIIDPEVFEKLLVALSLIEIRKDPKFKAMISHILTPSQDSRMSSVPENLSDLKTLVATFQVNNNFVNGREQFATHESPKDGKTPGRGNHAQAATTAMASTTNTGTQRLDCPCGAKRGPSHDANQCYFLKQRCKEEFQSRSNKKGGRGLNQNPQGRGNKYGGGNNKQPSQPQGSGAGKPVKVEGNTST
jgi:hypothetical protein